jgi:hypothetical protein
MAAACVIALAPSPAPDNEWSAVNAAVSYAQLAGLLAGFVFIALTIAITLPRDSDSEEQDAHRNSTTMLATAFVVLLVASLFYVVIAGDLNSYRATFKATVASSILALGALLLMSGTAWLFFEYQLPRTALSNFRTLSVLLLLLAASFVALTIEDITQWLEDDFANAYGRLIAPVGSIFLTILLFASGRLAVANRLGRTGIDNSQIEAARLIAVYVQRVCQTAIFNLFLASIMMAWFVSSQPLRDGPGETSSIMWEYLSIAYIWLPLQLVLYVAVVLAIPWPPVVRDGSR